ncbi:MAG: hypothetical protein H6835_17010 [Planctomycetes bacterium]|nr:hypothetical protein [Planctomycetota bacterium]
MHMLHRSSAALLCGALSLPAQSFVVDLANGPGTDFTSLAAALQFVPDGATIQVRAGDYQEFVQLDGKGVTIVADPGVNIVAPLVAVGILVRHLSPAQTVVLRGLNLQSTALGVTSAGMTIEDNQGQVFVDGMSGAGGRYMLVANSASVLIARSSFVAPNQTAVTAVDCEAVFDRCTIQELAVTGGSWQFANCSLSGRSGFFTNGGNALTMNGGAVRVLGGQLAGGASLGGAQGAAVVGSGDVRVATGTQVTGAIAPTINFSTAPMPHLSSAIVPGGGYVEATLHGPVGQLAVLLIATRSLPQTVPGLDPIWLDGATFAVQAFGVPGASAPVVSVTQVPAAPGLSGLALVWQGLGFDANGALSVGNPVWYVLP